MSEIKKAQLTGRNGIVEVKGHTFTVRRPTVIEYQVLQKLFSDMNNIEQAHYLAKNFTVGWKDVKAMDIEPRTKSDDVVDFDKDIWNEWVDDRMDFWVPLSEKIIQMFNKYFEDRELAAKN